MVNSLHRGQEVRNGGASRADVTKMLQNIDANGDGQVSNAELQGLADKGRARGFADKDSLELFRAGLDAGGLAEVKARESGQQLSTEYLDKKMKPLLEKPYGKNGAAATDLVAQQSSRELTKDAAQRFGDSAAFKKTHGEAIGRTLGKDAILTDTNKDGKVDAKDRRLVANAKGGYDNKELGQTKADEINAQVGPQFGKPQQAAIERNIGKGAIVADSNKDGRVDAKDRTMVPNGNGGYEWKEIGQKKADKVNEEVGLGKGREILAGGPHFPNSPGNPSWATRDPKTGAKEEWMGGKKDGPWKMQEIPKGKDGAGSQEFKLDTSKMSASEALDDMKKNPKNYCFDCAMGKQVVQYARVREMLGDEKFNELAKKQGMTIGHSDAAYRSGMLSKMTGEAAGGSKNMDLKDYKPGWQGYAKVDSVGNKDVQESLARGGWGGEHFTVSVDEKGQKVVTAHPFGTHPVAEFDKLLKDRLMADSGGKIKREDIKISYSAPLDSDVELARSKL